MHILASSAGNALITVDCARVPALDHPRSAITEAGLGRVQGGAPERRDGVPMTPLIYAPACFKCSSKKTMMRLRASSAELSWNSEPESLTRTLKIVDISVGS